MVADVRHKGVNGKTCDIPSHNEYTLSIPSRFCRSALRWVWWVKRLTKRTIKRDSRDMTQKGYHCVNPDAFFFGSSKGIGGERGLP